MSPMRRNRRGKKAMLGFAKFAMEFFFLDLDLDLEMLTKNPRSLPTQQGHLHHRLVAARRRRPGAPDHVQEPHQVGSVSDEKLCCTSDKNKTKNSLSNPEKTKLFPRILPLPPPPPSHPQRHLLRGRRHLRRHRRHHPPDEDRVRGQKPGRKLARLCLHERLRAPGGRADDGLGQPRVRALRGRRRLLGGAVGRGELDAVRQNPGGGDLRVRAGAVWGEFFFKFFFSFLVLFFFRVKKSTSTSSFFSSSFLIYFF